MAVVAWPDGVPRLGNLLAAFPWTQALTWLLQIMPLFFFAGGAASALSWDRHAARGGSYAAWLWARADRLLRPAWVYLAVMSVVATLVTVLAPAEVVRAADGAHHAAAVVPRRLPARHRAHPAVRRHDARRAARASRWRCSRLRGLVDAARFLWGWPEAIGLVNFVLVWTVPAYLGSLRAHGTLAAHPVARAGRHRWSPGSPSTPRSSSTGRGRSRWSACPASR